MRYSGFRVIAEALTGHKGWKPAWRDPAPQAAYDYIIVGGGGHGLATAYYLAKEFKQARIAVLEKGWIGGGNVGRNTTIVRSNYLLDGNQPHRPNRKCAIQPITGHRLAQASCEGKTCHLDIQR